MNWLTNKTFDQIKVGDSASLSKKLTMKEIELFALASGDFNPFHLDEEFAKKAFFGKIIAHGMWTASLISAVLGNQLPGPGTIYLTQSIRFCRPVMLDDVITARVTVIKKNIRKPVVYLSCECTNQHGKLVMSGISRVLAPTQSIHCEIKKIKTDL
ncbi:MAG: MaoC/PaaZ C-terminal domain-containing protein [Gammaproteobacteria bacterium]|nr:MaoC/PaaZ C-terminal domain-containing protein [Gammaproteobacteria bacterium]